jgi:hypothetical protein
VETPLRNPEPTWERAENISVLSVLDVERRLGKVDSELQLLSGGQANLNIRVGADRVLRIYRRDPATLRKEVELLTRPWASFQVPALLERGDDFLLIEFVAHTPLTGSAAHGEWAGRALAEIHSHAYSSSGFFGRGMSIVERLDDFIEGLSRYVREQFEHLEHPHVGQAVMQLLEAQADAMRAVAMGAVLLHGDFKPANVHASSTGRLLVLDWEFAYAGPRLMDIGQLVRWGCPEPFRQAFAASYRAAGGVLPDDWERWAGAFDLCNLVGLLQRATPGSRRERDLNARIQQTLLAFR